MEEQSDTIKTTGIKLYYAHYSVTILYFVTIDVMMMMIMIIMMMIVMIVMMIIMMMIVMMMMILL